MMQHSGLLLTLNILNCFQDYKRCIHISYHILDCFQQKKTKFTLEQLYNGAYPMLLIPCLLMPWLLKSPGHQQTWYWPNKMEYSISISEEFTFKIHILFLLERGILLWLKINIWSFNSYLLKKIFGTQQFHNIKWYVNFMGFVNQSVNQSISQYFNNKWLILWSILI